MNDRQVQKAGADSQQFQVAGNFIFNQGVTEERAYEIADFTARQAITEFSAEATSLAYARMQEFDQKLVKVLASLNQLEAFADPAFHVMLAKAHLGAASSDREANLDMLARLLSDRIERGEDRNVRAGIHRAVEIVDQVDDRALRGLTVFYAVTLYLTTMVNLWAALDSLDRAFGQLLDGSLPLDDKWLDHLDILDAVRTSRSFNVMPFHEFLGEQMVGFLAPGVRKDSDADIEALKFQSEAEIDLNVIDHELLPGFVRVSAVNLVEFEKLVQQIQSKEQRESFLKIAVGSYGLGAKNGALLAPFKVEIEKRPNLHVIMDWWDQFPLTFQMTEVGRALASANIKRLDFLKLLPNLF